MTSVAHQVCIPAAHFHHVLMQGHQAPPFIPPNANIGQSLGNFRKNYRQVRTQALPVYRVLYSINPFLTCCGVWVLILKWCWAQTVCTYWLKGLCMKGEDCGFLHQLDPQRMPVCRTLLKFGECKDPECQFKHNLEEVKVRDCSQTPSDTVLALIAAGAGTIGTLRCREQTV